MLEKIPQVFSFLTSKGPGRESFFSMGFFRPFRAQNDRKIVIARLKAVAIPKSFKGPTNLFGILRQAQNDRYKRSSRLGLHVFFVKREVRPDGRKLV
jgi:hypothetical protein